MTDLWIRKAGLLVYAPPPSAKLVTPDTGLDLSEMRITFDVQQSNYETPNTLRCRVYNLKDETSQLVYSEFTRVNLSAGYRDGPFGTIFDGFIKQVVRGRQSATDSYLDIFASDGDVGYASVINKTLTGPVTAADQMRAINAAFGAKGVPAGYVMDLPPTATLPRGKVMYGHDRDYARDFANTIDADWSIQNGKVQWVPRTGYRPGEAVELDPRSGLVGVPAQTPGGIEATALLNPRIGCGLLVKINSALVAEGFSAASTDPGFLQDPRRLETYAGKNAKISQSGLYKVVVCEHTGDTRGPDWYSNIVGLAVDPTAGPGAGVKPYWAGSNEP
jgi:hypothetical protein